MSASRVQSLRRRVAAIQVELALCMEELLELVEQDERRDQGTRSAHHSAQQGRRPKDPSGCTPVVDGSTFTVTWNGKACHLGCGVPFRLFERLSRRPDQFISYDRLIEDVWLGAPRSDETIRSEMKRVRRRLKAAGMPELAEAIKGRNRHYGLLLRSSV